MIFILELICSPNMRIILFSNEIILEIILKLTLNYKMYLEWQHRMKINNSRLSRIEQFISNFHESHRLRNTVSVTEEKNQWETGAKQTLNISSSNCRSKKKKKEIIGKFNADHSCVHVDHRYLSVMDHLSPTGIAWIACTIIVIVNYTGWRTALIWGSELDFRVIRHVGSWI